MKRWTAFAALAAVAFLASPRARAAPQPVDALGDPARLRIEGLSLLKPEEVRQALRDDADYQLASSPSAPLDDLLKVIPAQLTLACQRAGFPDAKVRAVLDAPANQVVVRIAEGSRYVAGDVLVEGARQLDAKRLAAGGLAAADTRFPMETLPDGSIRVQTWGEPKDPPKPLWNKSQPAPFDHVALKRLRRDFAAEMARQGFFNPDFELAHRREGQTAHLVVAVRDEGPRATLAQVEIKRLNRNKPQDVRRYLGLVDGTPVDSDVLQSLAAKLWASARFWKHPITVTPLAEGGGKVKLTIDLDEHLTAPLLGEKFTVDEEALLRVREGLDALARGNRDVVVNVHAKAFDLKFIIRSGHGIALRFKPGDRDAARSIVPAQFAPLLENELGFASSPTQFGFYDVTGQTRYVARARPEQVEFVAEIRFVPALEENSTDKSQFNIGAGFTSKGKSRGKAITMNVLFAPVCFLDLVHRAPGAGKVGAEAKDGIISFSVGRLVVRFRQDTGDLVEARSTADDSGEFVAITLERGALERESAALDAAVKTPNLADPDRQSTATLPVLAHLFGQFLGMASGASAEQRAAGARVLTKLARGPMADWADALAQSDDDDDELSVPVDPDNIPPAGTLAFLAQGVPLCDRVFARPSWPWTLARESMLVASGRGKHSRAEAARLYRSEETGPLGFLAIAYAYSHLDAPSARIFAKRGLERLDFDRFSNDCRALFAAPTDGRSPMTALAKALRMLDEQDVQAIAGLLPPRPAAALKILVQHQRRQPADAPDLIPRELQKQLWDAGVKQALESALTHYSKLD
jgi:hypothetical protein